MSLYCVFRVDFYCGRKEVYYVGTYDFHQPSQFRERKWFMQNAYKTLPLDRRKIGLLAFNKIRHRKMCQRKICDYFIESESKYFHSENPPILNLHNYYFKKNIELLESTKLNCLEKMDSICRQLQFLLTKLTIEILDRRFTQSLVA